MAAHVLASRSGVALSTWELLKPEKQAELRAVLALRASPWASGLEVPTRLMMAVVARPVERGTPPLGPNSSCNRLWMGAV